MTKQTTDSSVALNEELEKLLKGFDILFLIYTLKSSTDKVHALSIPEICAKMNELFSAKGNHQEEVFNVRTIRRLVESISNLFISKTALSTYSRQLLSQVIGGEIRCRLAVSGKNVRYNASHSQQKYYFLPTLNNTDTISLHGAIMNSDLLSLPVKKSLISKLNLFGALTGCNASCTEMPVHLLTVSRLHEAIENQYQLNITFEEPENHFQKILINPYALLNHSGHTYLIGTRPAQKIPELFRTEQITDIEPNYISVKNDTFSIQSREPIPAFLDRFFNANGSEFNQSRFIATFPHLEMEQPSRKVNCEFKCSHDGYLLLSDTFGKENLKLTESGDSAYRVRVNYVQYENAVKFAANNLSLLTPVSPAELVQDVVQLVQSFLDNCKE